MRTLCVAGLALALSATAAFAESFSSLPQERADAIKTVCRTYTAKFHSIPVEALRTVSVYQRDPGVLLTWHDCLRDELAYLAARR